jgi:hypothetical protein
MLSRDFLLKWYFSRRVERRSSKSVFLGYAEPLAEATARLFRRLNRILSGEQSGFLIKDNRKAEFDQYKWTSTLYRFAVVLAWIRAIRREHTFIKVDGRLADADKAINEFRDALSNGRHVQVERINRLAEVWDLVPHQNGDAWRRTAVEVSRLYRSMLGDKDRAAKLGTARKRALCKAVYHALSKGCSGEPKAYPGGSEGDAARAMDIRTAWIFRDWQAAIGDLLLTKADVGGRRFDVIGFREFERKMAGHLEGSKKPIIGKSRDVEEMAKWTGRLSDFFNDIKIPFPMEACGLEPELPANESHANGGGKSDDGRAWSADARRQTLERVAEALANLLLALDKVEPDHRLVDDKHRKLAKKFKENKGPFLEEPQSDATGARSGG